MEMTDAAHYTRLTSLPGTRHGAQQLMRPAKAGASVTPLRLSTYLPALHILLFNRKMNPVACMTLAGIQDASPRFTTPSPACVQYSPPTDQLPRAKRRAHPFPPHWQASQSYPG